ncbi:MAG: glycoside hydrolase family 3 N-terminal domain-containing protein [Fervidobacterium sp.]|uniref:glycoside hydrolase family 3 N-terminal domain-containing protein n=1 Tax=Fervidobacterium sp. TaxID=1871331 RepID=UPI003098EE3E
MEIYKDSSKPIELRVEDLLSRMTLEEKVSQLGSIWSYQLLDENGNFDEVKAFELLKNSIGQISRPGGATNFQPEEVAEFDNKVQRFLIENTRLGIPALMHEECLTGYMGLNGSNFPVPIAMASTWEPELVKEVTKVIRLEMRNMGIHQGLAPVLDVARDPRWGRVEETFGESPYLVASMGCAYVEGLQGEDLRDGVIATTKHFVGYSASEGGRNWAPTNIPPRELREVFMFPFEAAVKVAKVGSVMNSYSEIDGVPLAASGELLTDVLRKEWRFDGLVVSDYFSVKLIHEHHKLARDKAEAAKYALEAGIDVELPNTDCYAHVLDLVKSGVIPEKLLDQTVRRILKMKFKLGLFDKPYVEPSKAKVVKNTELALEVARKSIVLLKNDGILPLKKDMKVALIGPNAADVRNMLGDYMYLAHIKIMLENVNLAFDAPKFNLSSVKKSVEESMNKIKSIEMLLKEESVQFTYAKGCDVLGDSKEGFNEALKAVENSDVAIVVVGDRSGLTMDCTTGESRDSANLKLPGVQEELIIEVSKVGKPVVLALLNGRPYSLTRVVDKVSAIVEAWLPGEIGAKAIVDVLYGKVNPSGKLPMTFPRSAGQIPLFHYFKPSGGRSSWHGDYVDESVKPLFPFGHGLSYTNFDYSGLEISPSKVPMAGSVEISLYVENTGEVEGEEVVQLYIGRECASVTRPVKELKGFAKVNLKPGEKRKVLFNLHTDVLAFYGRDMKLCVEPGVYNVMIGSSSDDIRLKGSFEVDGMRREVFEDRVFFTKVYTF